MSLPPQRARILAGPLGVAAVLGLLLLSACGLSRPYPAIRSFSLEPPAPDSAPAAAKNRRPLLVQVSPGGAAPQYETAKLIYRIGPNEFRGDFYNELVGLPARLVADRLAAFLDRRSPLVQASQGIGARAPDLSLDVFLLAFHGDYTQSPPLAVVEAKISLTDLRRGRSKGLFSKTYSGQAVLPADPPDRPADQARGLAEALAPILSEALADLERSLRGQP
ncbi:MAG: PqiC family protein [Deltaproteobacteria bacterium]|jgi:ABC-type uncharacterized transport system auxiliary subunit|nr:PqiC family protein [Deltaproteobacteria bacterium]